LLLIEIVRCEEETGINIALRRAWKLTEVGEKMRQRNGVQCRGWLTVDIFLFRTIAHFVGCRHTHCDQSASNFWTILRLEECRVQNAWWNRQRKHFEKEGVNTPELILENTRSAFLNHPLHELSLCRVPDADKIPSS
jgi:hypothetical protein